MEWKNWFKGAVLTGMLAGCFVLSASATDLGIGTVKGDGLRLRADAGIEYDVLASASEGDTVFVLEESDGWYKVDYGTQVGYMSEAYLDVTTDVEADLGYAMVTTQGDALNVRGWASAEANVVTKLPSGAVVQLTGFYNGWYKIAYGENVGYVLSDYITPVLDENGTRQDGATSAAQSSALGQKIVAEALKHVGKPYVYGAKGPNAFDCSGFAQYCTRVASGGAINLPGGSSNQWTSAPGQRIYSMSQLQVGDLIYICDPAYSHGKITSHVAIYMGDGMIVHAASKGVGVVTNTIKDKDRRYFVGALRLG